MATEPEDEQQDEVFEINDFTVFSDMERLVVSIEATLQEWQLTGTRPSRKFPKGFLSQCNWTTKSTQIAFGEHNKLRVSFVQADCPEQVAPKTSKETGNEEEDLPALVNDLASAETDFVSRKNIVAMYGLSEYLLFSPERTVEDQISTEDQKNFIMSAMRTAAQSSECPIAMLLEYGDVDRQLFVGCATHRHVHTRFSGSHLRKLQARHTHLTGLLSIFKEEVKCPISLLDAEDIRVSVLFEYIYRDDSHFDRPSSLFEFSSSNQIDVMHLPMSSLEEPLEEFSLLATWPNIKEDMINENDMYSDLEPQSAFNWSAMARFSAVEGVLGSTLSRLLHLPRSSSGRETVKAMLGLSHTDPSATHIFGQLTGDSQAVRNLRIGGVAGGMGQVMPSVTNPGGIRMDELPLPIEKKVMDDWMKAVFGGASLTNSPEEETKPMTLPRVKPGSATRTKEFKVPEEAMKNLTITETEEKEDDSKRRISELFKSCKSLPEGDSLTARFMTALLHAAVEDTYGPMGLAQMWHSFVQALRWHFDWNKDLEGIRLNSSQPDLSKCLLHQKLEMLQCCIEARRRRHELYDKAKDFHTDEFFDAQSDIDEDDREEVRKDAEQTGKETEKDYSKMEPQGRLHPLGEQCLHLHRDIALFVPITQDRAPMTEDLLEEHAKMLTSIEDEEVRLEAQLDTLNSDMQAFKAANPKAAFEDFIRWHSPKDWNEEQGTLSERMQTPSNMWQKCWQTALPIPVINQARLFNETNIAEEILSMLENATIGKICELSLPAAFALAAQQLIKDSKQVADLVDSDKICRLVQAATRTGRRDDYLEALNQMKKVERTILLYRAAFDRLSRAAETSSSQPTEAELRSFVNCLLLDHINRLDTVEMNVVPRGIQIFGGANSSIGNAVRQLMQPAEGRNCLKKPARRFYTFRWNVPSPTKNSLVLPQRMFAAIELDTCRINGSFVRDTVFFIDG